MALGHEKAAEADRRSYFEIARGSCASVALATRSGIATLVLTFGVAWLLLFRMDWLADKLKTDAVFNGMDRKKWTIEQQNA